MQIHNQAAAVMGHDLDDFHLNLPLYRYNFDKREYLERIKTLSLSD